MRNGYLRYFVVSTYLNNDSENQLLLCIDIMRRHLAWEIVTLCIRVNLPQCKSGNMHTKIIVLHTTDFVYFVMRNKLILIVFFIKYVWVFTENTLLI